MSNMFKGIIGMYEKGAPVTQETVGESMILVNKEGFDLIIPKNNHYDYGIFLVNSIKGHDCYSYNSKSTHIYRVLNGEGEFIIDDETFFVKEGDVVMIEPNKIFYYRGKMLMTMEMRPNFQDENNHVVEAVNYPEDEKSSTL